MSRKFFEKLELKLKDKAPNLNGYYNVFNNNREQGLMAHIYEVSTDNEICIWACQSRNSDQIMIIIADRNCCDNNSMFNDIAYKKAKYFSYNDYDTAVNYIIDSLKVLFRKSFLEKVSYNFTMNKSLSELEKIINDAENLDYEDYYDLVTFENVNDGYLCDLIILNGDAGLRYSKYEDGQLENLSFEMWEPDLSNEITIMLGMKNKLNDFIENELDYNINF